MTYSIEEEKIENYKSFLDQIRILDDTFKELKYGVIDNILTKRKIKDLIVLMNNRLNYILKYYNFK